MSERKLKIAFLSVFHPFRGGIAQFNTELFKALEEKAQVQAFNFSTQYPNLLFPGKTQFVDQKDLAPNFKTPQYLSSINPLTFNKTASAIKKYNPDVLITSYWMPFFAPSLGSVCKKLKKNTINIGVCHNVIPHESRKGDAALTKYYLNQQDGFVVMSETVQRDLLSLKPGAKNFLRPHPLYAQFGAPKNKSEMRLKYGVKEGQKVLLFFGFVRKYKGLDLLLEALPYCNENTVVLIAGECYGEFTEYQNTIDQHQLSSRILNHVRYIPDAEVAEVFSVTDVCVLPYRSATQSGIASIAKYYQVPMVVTPVGELPNELIDGETGVVCESSAPQKIAEGINRCLLSLPTFSEALKAEKDEHNWKNFSSELIAFVNALDASI